MAIVITIESEVGPIHTIHLPDGENVVDVPDIGIDSGGHVYLQPGGAAAGEAAWLELDPVTGALSATRKGALA